MVTHELFHWWSHEHMVLVTALDIQVSLHNPTAMLEDSMTSLKTLYRLDVFYLTAKKAGC